MLRSGCFLDQRNACSQTCLAPSEVAILVIPGNSIGEPARTVCANESAPSVSTAMTGISVQLFRCSPSTTPLSKPPPPTDRTIASGLAPDCTISSTRLAWPRQMRGSSNGCKNASDSPTIDNASSFASCQEAPWTINSASSCCINDLALSVVVSGTTTTTGTDKWRPA